MTHQVVFLLDVDNTLLDNDRIADDLRAHLTGNFGKAGERYWAHFEELRKELGYADYLGALQRYRADLEGNGAGGAPAAFGVAVPDRLPLCRQALSRCAGGAGRAQQVRADGHPVGR